MNQSKWIKFKHHTMFHLADYWMQYLAVTAMLFGLIVTTIIYWLVR